MSSESLLSSVLLQLILMIATARLMNLAFKAAGQPGVIGEIIAGLLLGPSLFGHFFPGLSLSIFGATANPAITVPGQIGLILLMFQIGCDFEFGLLRGGGAGKAVGSIALASIAAPFLLGCGFGALSHRTLAASTDVVAYSLFCGVSVATTAVPILGRILRQYGLTDQPIGVVAITAAAVNDVVGWVMLGGIATYASSAFSVTFLLRTIGSVAALGAVLWFLLRPAADWLIKTFPVSRNTVPGNLMAFLFCMIFLLAITTSSIGIFTVFGGFAGGLLFHRHTAFVEAWRNQVGQFVLVFFLPIFFTATGLRTDILGLSSADLGWLGLLLAIAVLGKIVPVYAAGRASGLGHWQAGTLGSLMNTRGLMELIVLNVGYNLGAIPQGVFTLFVIMAIVTSMMTGPLLKVLLPRMAHVAPVLLEA